MARRNRRVQGKKQVDYLVDQFVIAMLLLPLLPWMMALAGQERIAASEVGGLIALAIVFWAIALGIGWRAGGPAYLVESCAFALIFLPLSPWLFALAEGSAPAGLGLVRVLVATALCWLLSALIAWRFALWPFESAQIRAQRHAVLVLHVDPPEREYDPYFVATCECGWLSDIHETEGAAFAEARRHSPRVDVEVKRPLDPDYVPPSDAE